MHESGCRTFAIRRWSLDEGNLRPTVNLSTQTSGLTQDHAIPVDGFLYCTDKLSMQRIAVWLPG